MHHLQWQHHVDWFVSTPNRLACLDPFLGYSAFNARAHLPCANVPLKQMFSLTLFSKGAVSVTRAKTIVIGLKKHKPAAVFSSCSRMIVSSARPYSRTPLQWCALYFHAISEPHTQYELKYFGSRRRVSLLLHIILWPDSPRHSQKVGSVQSDWAFFFWSSLPPHSKM